MAGQHRRRLTRSATWLDGRTGTGSRPCCFFVNGSSGALRPAARCSCTRRLLPLEEVHHLLLLPDRPAGQRDRPSGWADLARSGRVRPGRRPWRSTWCEPSTIGLEIGGMLVAATGSTVRTGARPGAGGQLERALDKFSYAPGSRLTRPRTDLGLRRGSVAVVGRVDVRVSRRTSWSTPAWWACSSATCRGCLTAPRRRSGSTTRWPISSRRCSAPDTERARDRPRPDRRLRGNGWTAAGRRSGVRHGWRWPLLTGERGHARRPGWRGRDSLAAGDAGDAGPVRAAPRAGLGRSRSPGKNVRPVSQAARRCRRSGRTANSPSCRWWS